MKKAVIHGANREGQRFAMMANYVFDIRAFIDRNAGAMKDEFDGIPIYSDFSKVKDSDIDYIFVLCEDYDGVLREYEDLFTHSDKNKGGLKIMSMLYGHQMQKQKQFLALANEIYRKKVPGSVVELGVDFGETAKYINLFFDDRPIYLFDTFKGFNVADVQHERLLNTMTENMVHYYDNRSNEADVLKRMFYPQLCVVKKGIFPDSLEGLEDTFAFVHIDCDLSKPIHDALEYFYPRLTMGGFLCVHDYFNRNYAGVRAVVRDFTERQQAKMVPVPGYDGIIISK